MILKNPQLYVYYIQILYLWMHLAFADSLFLCKVGFIITFTVLCDYMIKFSYFVFDMSINYSCKELVLFSHYLKDMFVFLNTQCICYKLILLNWLWLTLTKMQQPVVSWVWIDNVSAVPFIYVKLGYVMYCSNPNNKRNNQYII